MDELYSVGSSAVSMMSFRPTGMPCSGPRRGERSSARACASACALSTNAHARISSSRAAMRSRHAATSASLVSSPRSMRRAASAAESEEFAPSLWSISQEVRVGLLGIGHFLRSDAIARDDLLHFGGGDAVHLRRVQAEDLGAQRGGDFRIAESFPIGVRYLKRSERHDLVLRRAVPDRVGAPKHVVFSAMA